MNVRNKKEGVEMANEQERVLEMVADGTITAADGVKLLEALGSASDGPELGKASRRRKTIHTRSMLNEIGPMIQATMGDVFKGRKSSVEVSIVFISFFIVS